MNCSIIVQLTTKQREVEKMRLPTISFPLKVTILGTTVGITLIGLLAAYFRRRKKRRPYRDIKPEDLVKQSNHLSHSSMQSGRSPNGGEHTVALKHSFKLIFRRKKFRKISCIKI